MSTAVGLDIGSYSITAVQLSFKGEDVHLLGAIRQLRPEAVVSPPDDVLSGTDLLLAKHLSAVPAGWKSVVIGITGRELNLSLRFLPSSVKVPIERMLQFEVNQAAGATSADVYWSYIPLAGPVPSELEAPLLLGLARKGAVERRFALLKQAAAGVKWVSPNAVALHAAYLLTDQISPGITMLVDIGHRNTEMALVEQEKLLFARNLSQGAIMFTQAISSTLQLSPLEAERLKLEKGTLQPQAGEKQQPSNVLAACGALHNSAAQFAQVLNSALKFATTQMKAEKIPLARILLSGGGAKLSGLPEFLSSSFQVPVKPLNVWSRCQLSSIAPEVASVLASLPSEFAVALGLASLTTRRPKHTLSFVPEKVQRRRHLITSGLYQFVGAAVLLLASIVAAIIGKHNLKAQQRIQEQIQQQQQLLDASAAKAAELDTQNKQLKTQYQTLWTHAQAGRFLLQFLNLICRLYSKQYPERIPPGVHLRELVLKKNPEPQATTQLSLTAKGAVSGTADPEKKLASYLNALTTLSSELDIKLVSSSYEPSEPGTLLFTVRIKPRISAGKDRDETD